MLGAWIGLALLGVVFGYQHFRSLRSLVLSGFGSGTSPSTTRQFQLRWWARHLLFLLTLGALAFFLKRAAIPFLLGVALFELVGKKLFLWREAKRREWR